MKAVVTFLVVLLLAIPTKGQILISLLLGDKLNSGKVEFGLDGGVNYPTIRGIEGDKWKGNFNIGFYFDIKTKNPHWMMSTGVLVKATLGTSGLAPYSLNDQNLDAIFANGEVHRKINYFNVPIGVKYKINNHFFLQSGIMPSLRSRAYDIFTADQNGDVEYKLDIRDNIHRLDFGMLAGAGYRLLGGNGVNLSVRYYYGLVDFVINDSTPDQFNQSLYIAVGIPIGAGKAKARENKVD